jgi:peptide/nickel transport system permease protein
VTSVVLTRSLWAAGTLAGAVSMAFLLVVWAPGDPIDLLPDGEALRPTLAARWQLDRPVWERLLRWWALLLSGELGTSMSVRPGAPVGEVVARPALATAWRVAAAWVVLFGSGVALAFATAERGRRWAGAWVHAVSLVPLFLLAHASIWLLNESAFAGMQRGWFDRPSWFALPDVDSWLRTGLAVALLALGSSALAEVHTELQRTVVQLRTAPFVVAARARGEGTGWLVLHHLLPTVCSLGAQRVAWLLGGAVVVEKLLMLPGAGSTLWEAALQRDYEVVLALSLMAAAVVVACRLLADLARAALDPRLRSRP